MAARNQSVDFFDRGSRGGGYGPPLAAAEPEELASGGQTGTVVADERLLEGIAISDSVAPPDPDDQEISHVGERFSTQGEVTLEHVIGQEDRDAVVGNALRRRPYEAICHITSWFGGRPFVGTGALCRPNAILTCAHNMFSHVGANRGQRADRVELNFAMSPNSSGIVRKVNPNGFRICERYRRGDDVPENDYGVMFFDRPIMDVAPLRIVPIVEAHVFSSIRDRAEIPGYPIRSQLHHTTMYTSQSRILDVDTRGRIFHEIDATQGQSGAPIIGWFPVNGRRAPGIIGVHNKESAARHPRENYGAFVDEKMKAELQRWL